MVLLLLQKTDSCFPFQLYLIYLRYVIDKRMEDTKLDHPIELKLLDLLTAIACLHKVKPQLKSQEGSDSG
ncbi:hypothetical protein HGM15179_000169 [Zosterops borbonicus]|uniref:Uncharacterized protein n=1 Tax=Zosterops borbonicus TaxID=364589 RepID=A0A8K1LVB9_9PASS|nr:hypothetical protein HGM15179_000169 [Zosterops borbonicus]